MTTGWCLRASRAAVFAAVCALLAATGHGMVSGCVVPWWAIGTAVVGAGGGAWFLTGRERGFALVVSVTMAAQTVLHCWYLLVPVVRPHGPYPAHPAAHAAHHHAVAAGATPDPMAGLGHSGHDMAGMSSTGMLAAHALAALLCGLWLACGERAAFRILRALAGWLVAPLRLPLPPRAASRRPRVGARRGRSVRVPRRPVLVHVITSRGPPAGTAVV
ncbi:hypothetical protein AB0F77_03445 [Streptomyces sp. NPDC026672]|uniref:hypothetical protein n=1 Tax=unclassified Streptomyces TaxID=2593676 RepID=UPI00340A52BC